MDLYIPIYDYESNGRTYELSLSEYSINYFGDSKEVKFPIHMRDKKTNMVLFDVYYKYRTNSKDLYMDHYEIDEYTSDYILMRDGCYSYPEFPKEDIVIPLFDSFLKYMQDHDYSIDKTLFSSETSE